MWCITNEIPVLIHLESIAHREDTGQDDRINLLVTGKLLLEEERAVILYDEMMEESTEHVELVFHKDMLTVNRSGDYSSQLSFSIACRSEGTYHTPFGDIMLGIFTTRLSYDINEIEGTLSLSYQLDMNGHFAAVHNIEMHILRQIDQQVKKRKPRGKVSVQPDEKL